MVLLGVVPWAAVGSGALLGVVDIEVMEPIVENVFRQPFQLTDFLWV